MRRIVWIAAAGLALAAAGLAIARVGPFLKTDPVAAEFTAARTSDLIRVCTDADGHSYRITKARLEGSMTSGDSRLSGRIVLRLRIIEDAMTGLGTTDGRIWILDGGRPKVAARVIGVNTRGALNGVFDGRVFRGAWLVANFSASWDGTTLRGELGQDSPIAPTNAAVIQPRLRCEPSEKNPGSGRLEIRKALSPAADSGRFDLRIDSTTHATGVGNGGSTGEKVVSAGRHEVSEVGAGGTSLESYAIGIVCRDGDGNGRMVARGGGRDGDLIVAVARDADVVCVITNTREDDD